MRLRGAGAKQGSTVAFFPVKQRDSGDFLTLGQAGGQQTDLGARSSAELGFIRMTSKLRMGVVFLKDCLKKKEEETRKENVQETVCGPKSLKCSSSSFTEKASVSGLDDGLRME